MFQVFETLRPTRRVFSSTIVKSLSGVAVLAGLGAVSLSWAEPLPGNLDICEYRPTFEEDFDALSVAAWEATDATWIAHTPWWGDFGDAAFTDPGPDFPFQINDGILTITARKDETGKWRSGLLSSTDPEARGFAQTYGYFEMRAKLPKGPGLWPAFWLRTNEPRDRKEPAIEIDVLEHYGRAPDEMQMALHIWQKDPPRSETPLHKTLNVPENSLYEEFHTYGVDVTPEFITYYLDREAVWQLETPAEHKLPLGILVNLAMGSGWPIDETPDPSVMEVDYVHAYERRSTGSPSGCQS